MKYICCSFRVRWNFCRTF